MCQGHLRAAAAGGGQGRDDQMKRKVQSHRDLEVYGKGFEAAMQLFELSRVFPKEETYSLTD
jgi:hypothetical protein